LELKVRNDILDAQRRHLRLQARRLAAKRRRRRKPRKTGDLAYCVEPSGKGFKAKAQGPYVVDKIAGQPVWLRIIAAVDGQHSKMFKKHISHVARTVTVTDVLENLLRHAGYSTLHEPIQVDSLAVFKSSFAIHHICNPGAAGMVHELNGGCG
jgi:hypothetical protein